VADTGAAATPDLTESSTGEYQVIDPMNLGPAVRAPKGK
jgi:hypothetical protein